MSGAILVVEDDPSSLELMTYLLQAHGYRTLNAMRGDDAVALAREHRPDLTICDIQLPGLDGYEVARTLKADPATASLRLIAVTALAMVGDRDRVLACGFDGYVSKPIDPATFIEQLMPWGLAPPKPTSTRATASPAPPRSTPGSSQQQVNATILVVDDSCVNIELKRSILEPQGYTVIAANTAEEGLALARRARPALIFTDIGLPGATGFQLLQWIRADAGLATTPVFIITSTHSETSSRRLAENLGATRFLMRPLEPHALLKEVSDCMRAAQEQGRGNHSGR